MPQAEHGTRLVARAAVGTSKPRSPRRSTSTRRSPRDAAKARAKVPDSSE